MKKIIITNCFLFLIVTIYNHTIAQHDQQPKNIDALSIYSKMIENGVKDPKIIKKLATVHYLNSKFDEAIKWYDKYYSNIRSKPTIIDNYRYGQCLKTQKKYQKADSLLTTYYEHKGLRYSSLLENRYMESFTNEGVYQLKNYSWNSDRSEYPATILENKLFVVGNYVGTMSKTTKDKNTTDVFGIDHNTGKHTPLSEQINSIYNEGPIAITNDGKYMYFSRNNYHKDKIKENNDELVTINIYRAEYKNGAWKNIKPLPFNCDEHSMGHPTLSADNKTLYFISNKPGGKGETDLYKVAVFEDGTYGEVKNLTHLNTINKEMFPFIDRQNGDLYFASNRPSSIGGLDMYIAKMSSENGYVKAYNLGDQINSSYDDFALVIGTNRMGYFASNRINDIGSDDIYAFEATRDFEVPNYVQLSGYIKGDNDEPIQNMKISLYDKNNKKIQSVLTTEDGYYVFDENKSANIAYIKAEKKGYLASEKSINRFTIMHKKLVNLKIHSLYKKIAEKIDVTGQLKDQYTGQPIANADIFLVDNENNIIDKTTSDQKGSYYFSRVNSRETGFIRFYKKGFQSEEKEIDITTMTSNTLKADVNFVKNIIDINPGEDIAKILNPIYFEFGKSEIHSESALELEKIVQVLKEFPTLQIHIESHTDSRGKSETNLELSKQRSYVTYQYLLKKGIDKSRLTYQGYGETKLINKCENGIPCPDELHKFNRRSSFKIVSSKLSLN